MTTSSESKQAYQEKVKAQLDRLNAQIDELKTKAAKAKVHTAIEYQSQMQELYVKRGAVQSKLAELQQSGEEAWEEIQAGFERAWNDLNSAFESATAKLK